MGARLIENGMYSKFEASGSISLPVLDGKDATIFEPKYSGARTLLAPVGGFTVVDFGLRGPQERIDVEDREPQEQVQIVPDTLNNLFKRWEGSITRSVKGGKEWGAGALEVINTEDFKTALGDLDDLRQVRLLEPEADGMRQTKVKPTPRGEDSVVYMLYPGSDEKYTLSFKKGYATGKDDIRRPTETFELNDRNRRVTIVYTKDRKDPKITIQLQRTQPEGELPSLFGRVTLRPVNPNPPAARVFSRK